MSFASGLREINRMRAKEGRKPTSAAMIRARFNPETSEKSPAQKEASKENLKKAREKRGAHALLNKKLKGHEHFHGMGLLHEHGECALGHMHGGIGPSSWPSSPFKSEGQGDKKPSGVTPYDGSAAGKKARLNALVDKYRKGEAEHEAKHSAGKGKLFKTRNTGRL